jgi:hypothetical protein
MKVFNEILFTNKFILLLIIMLISGCHDSGELWRITVGLDEPKEKVFIDGYQPQEVMICLDNKGGSGYPTTVVAKYDDQRYAGMLEGQCMFFTGKRVAVKFGTPSSGKFAQGTYAVLEK